MSPYETFVEVPDLLSQFQRLTYTGNARYVAWWWLPVADALEWTDAEGGWAVVTTDNQVWHEGILPILQCNGWDCGDWDRFGPNILIWDRQEMRAWVAPRQLGLAFLVTTL